MSNKFPAFAKVVAANFQRLTEKGEVYVVDVSGDDLFASYLSAFPDGENPIFIERTEHDCSCCKGFIRRVGNVVSVADDGRISTIWDDAAEAAPYPYDKVAAKLADLIREKNIVDLFRVGAKETSFGAEVSRSVDKVNGKALKWNHFFTGQLQPRLCVATPDQVRGDYRTTVQVLERGLTELSADALMTVADLIDSKNLYRGEEHQQSVAAFRAAQQAYQQAENKNVLLWTQAAKPASRFRNTVIGTLVQDLSDGVDVAKAVASFEAKVAPSNYKRTTAVITPAMVQKAMSTIADLGLDSALERRFARIDDIGVNDVLWVDNSVKGAMKGGIGDVLMAHATASTRVSGDDEKRAEEIDIDSFIGRVLPESTSMEVLFKGRHLSNLMSLTAPIHPEPKQLFRWTNDFAWSYVGNIADSEIRRAVQSRGGRVDGVFRFSHSWNYDRRNTSLMDLHVFMPGHNLVRKSLSYVDDVYGNTERVGWNHRRHAASQGVQDVDYTAQAPVGYVPVENITFPDIRRMPDGVYVCKIHNWQLRHPTEGGFRAEIEFGGQVFEYERREPMKNKEWVTVASVTLRDGVFSIEHHMPCGSASQEKWGLSTETYVPVNAVTLSPNYWHGNKAGNRHTFFVLDGCKNDESCRGIYNEFLHPRLEEHRKVFEVIGEKTKCQPTEGQLSGLGFSSTKKDSVIVRVTQGKSKRLFNVRIGA